MYSVTKKKLLNVSSEILLNEPEQEENALQLKKQNK